MSNYRSFTIDDLNEGRFATDDTAKAVAELCENRPYILTSDFAKHQGVMLGAASSKLHAACQAGTIERIGNKGEKIRWRPVGLPPLEVPVEGSEDELCQAIGDLDEGRGVSAQQVADHLGITRLKASDRIDKAKRRGLVKRYGNNWQSRWMLTDAKIPDGPTPRTFAELKTALIELDNGEGVSLDELFGRMGYTKSAISSRLGRAKQKGLTRTVGKPPTIRWRLTAKGHKTAD